MFWKNESAMKVQSEIERTKIDNLARDMKKKETNYRNHKEETVGKLYDEDYLRAHIYNDVENLERWVSDNKNFLGTRLLIRFELV